MDFWDQKSVNDPFGFIRRTIKKSKFLRFGNSNVSQMSQFECNGWNGLELIDSINLQAFKWQFTFPIDSFASLQPPLQATSSPVYLPFSLLIIHLLICPPTRFYRPLGFLSIRPEWPDLLTSSRERESLEHRIRWPILLSHTSLLITAFLIFIVLWMSDWSAPSSNPFREHTLSVFRNHLNITWISSRFRWLGSLVFDRNWYMTPFNCEFEVNRLPQTHMPSNRTDSLPFEYFSFRCFSSSIGCFIRFMHCAALIRQFEPVKSFISLLQHCKTHKLSNFFAIVCHSFFWSL